MDPLRVGCEHSHVSNCDTLGTWSGQLHSNKTTTSNSDADWSIYSTHWANCTSLAPDTFIHTACTQTKLNHTSGPPLRPQSIHTHICTSVCVTSICESHQSMQSNTYIHLHQHAIFTHTPLVMNHQWHRHCSQSINMTKTEKKMKKLLKIHQNTSSHVNLLSYVQWI